MFNAIFKFITYKEMYQAGQWSIKVLQGDVGVIRIIDCNRLDSGEIEEYSPIAVQPKL